MINIDDFECADLGDLQVILDAHGLTALFTSAELRDPENGISFELSLELQVVKIVEVEDDDEDAYDRAMATL